MRFSFPAFSQGSSVVEQGTHKPLVGSSTLPPGSLCMAWVYILRGSSGRHYIGSAVDLDARFRQHLRGHTATTKRPGRFARDCSGETGLESWRGAKTGA